MANKSRRRAITVATALLAGSVVATVVYARRDSDTPRKVVSPLELTPVHHGGTGPPLLLLHGIGAIWRAWSPVLPYLEPYHEVIVPTLHGHAGGPALDSEVVPSVEALVDGIEAELDRMGLQKVHIAGNSLGGWIGIELARRGRAQSLVLLSPAGAWRSARRIKVQSVGVRLLARCARSLFVTGRGDRRTPPAALGDVGGPSSTSPPRGTGIVGDLHSRQRSVAGRRSATADNSPTPGRPAAR